MTRYKFGKLAPKPVPLKFRTYTRHLPPPPDVVGDDSPGHFDEGQGLGNDAVGDCTCAAAGHSHAHWNLINGRNLTASTEQVLAMYSAITGYNPNDPDSDTGAVVADVLKYWRQHGLILSDKQAHRILTGLQLSEGSHLDVMQAINYFDVAYIGTAVPDYFMAQFDNGEPWDVEGDPADANIEGGHAIIAVKADKTEGLSVITWGKIQRMTWAAFDAFVDEAYAILSPDLLSDKGLSPDGLDLDHLRADIEAL